ncbi:hypothetical protein Golomagni_08024 [Golovinomyces magnicellulatus]|nr:hypothetical protein Golomagni_08024 [Golovinomyces magnicellulatus]
MIGRLRQLHQDPSSQYVGSIHRKLPWDFVVEHKPKAGPFSSVKDFNDWFSQLDYLPDDGPIKFIHCDLHRGNIIVSTSKPCRVVGIVDWGQSGWFPDFWEYSKALYTTWYEDEWRENFIDSFLEPRLLESRVVREYATYIGGV